MAPAMWSGWRLSIHGAPALLALFCFVAQAESVGEVSIREYRYEPAEVRIRVGDSVRWTNHEKRTSHSVLFAAEGGLESERMFPDESWTRRFEKAGRYEYRCGPHPEMKGVVVVTD